MSCGEPHETDCTEVLAEVWLFLDNESGRERAELLARNRVLAVLTHLDASRG